MLQPCFPDGCQVVGTGESRLRTGNSCQCCANQWTAQQKKKISTWKSLRISQLPFHTEYKVGISCSEVMYTKIGEIHFGKKKKNHLLISRLISLISWWCGWGHGSSLSTGCPAPISTEPNTLDSHISGPGFVNKQILKGLLISTLPIALISPHMSNSNRTIMTDASHSL